MAKDSSTPKISKLNSKIEEKGSISPELKEEIEKASLPYQVEIEQHDTRLNNQSRENTIETKFKIRDEHDDEHIFPEELEM